MLTYIKYEYNIGKGEQMHLNQEITLVTSNWPKLRIKDKSRYPCTQMINMLTSWQCIFDMYAHIFTKQKSKLIVVPKKSTNTMVHSGRIQNTTKMCSSRRVWMWLSWSVRPFAVIFSSSAAELGVSKNIVFYSARHKFH